MSSCLSAPVSSSDEWGDTETPQLAAEAVSTRKMPVPSVPLTFPLRIGIPREFLSLWGEQVGMKGETGREDLKAHRPSFCLRVKLYACMHVRSLGENSPVIPASEVGDEAKKLIFLWQPLSVLGVLLSSCITRERCVPSVEQLF